MERELVFITVIGEDKKGIVARVSGFLFQCNINIEDIDQGVMQGYFVMTMAVDVKDATCDAEQVNQGLQQLGAEMGMTIQIQHENIFKAMHRI